MKRKRNFVFTELHGNQDPWQVWVHQGSEKNFYTNEGYDFSSDKKKVRIVEFVEEKERDPLKMDISFDEFKKMDPKERHRMLINAVDLHFMQAIMPQPPGL